jgi:hypothetical protein
MQGDPIERVAHVPLGSSIDGDFDSKTGNGHFENYIPIKMGGTAAMVAKLPGGMKGAKSLPEIGFQGGGQWIEYEIET